MGEVGKVGVAIDSLDDMRVLVRSVFPLDKVTTSMTINAPATVLLAMYLAIAEEQGVSFDKVGGTIQNDVLKEIICRGQYIYPPKPSMRLTVDLIEYCYKNVPKWNTISISGYHIREAGSTAAQEMAFTIADGIAYVQACVDRGMAVDSFGPRLSFFFNAFTNVLEEVAKFRAGRRYWAKVMKDRFGAKDPRSMMMRYHVQTGGVTLTAQQPLNNIVRVALQAYAAALGGCQSLHTNSYDEALCLPTQEAVTVALRTQQVVAEESGATDTIDPLAGLLFRGRHDRQDRSGNRCLHQEDRCHGRNPRRPSSRAISRRKSRTAPIGSRRKSNPTNASTWGSTSTPWKKRLPPTCSEWICRWAKSRSQKLKKLRAERDQAKWKKALDQLAGSLSDQRKCHAGSDRSRQGRGHGRRDLRCVARDLRRISTQGIRLGNRPTRTRSAEDELHGKAEKNQDRGCKTWIWMAMTVAPSCLARIFAEAGMEVVYTGLRQTPEMIVETALQEDADVVGMSSLSGSAQLLFPPGGGIAATKGPE